MPTLDDLTKAFDELGRQAPAALSEPIRSTRQHRWLAAGLAAACTAAVAVSVPLVLSAGQHRTAPTSSAAATHHPRPAANNFAAALPAPANGQSPALAYAFATDGVADAVRPDVVTRTYQHATITADSGNGNGELYVYYAGAYDPSAAEQGTPVQVNGRPGYYADVTLADGRTSTALVWEYAHDGWAVVRVGPVDDGAAAASKRVSSTQRDQASAAARIADWRQVELVLAEHTHSAAVAMSSPVRVLAPAGQYVDSLSSGAPDGGLTLDETDGTAWTLGWSAFALSTADKPDSSTVTIAGRQWIVYHAGGGAPMSLGLVADGWGMTVTPQDSATLEQMKQFAAGLQFASDLADQSTWFDAADALP